jgi:two-component sensor histidine kinase
LALAPVLLLGALQSAIMFQREAAFEREEMLGAAMRAAALVETRLAWNAVLLRALTSRTAGAGCAAGVRSIRQAVPGLMNVVRFGADGAVTCAAGPAPIDPARARRPWFIAAARGAAVSVTADPGAAYALEPALLLSVPASSGGGSGGDVLTAVASLASLRPDPRAPGAPDRAEVAFADAGARLFGASRASALPEHPGRSPRGGGGPVLWLDRDRAGGDRVYALAPVAGANLWILLATPNRSLVTRAWLNPVAAVVLPLLAFVLGLAGVWIVADREVVRWIAYIRRIAALYARGRHGVRPVRAAGAPPEIRDLAASLAAMADRAALRDSALRESLAQKDGLMREIHHRVKNNLQVICSLLSLQQRALSDPAARAAMSDTRQRITALALIYRALYEGPDLGKVDLREFLNDLITQLLSGDLGGRGDIRTDLSIDALSIDPDHLAPLALFAVEAITNAKKHALAPAGGRLEVVFHVRRGVAALAITDSGRPGAPPALVGEGVGRTLMLAFARQLGGEAQFVAEPGGGLTTRLTFPIPRVSVAA